MVEFFPIEAVESTHGKTWQLFSTLDGKNSPHKYFLGLKHQLETSHGVYVFHDSRGRAVYVGKAQKQSLWTEMNLAFNRDRKEVQSIKRVSHPSSNVEYARPTQTQRRIVREAVALHEIASYISAYQIPDGLIAKIEALIVRTLANDLLNVRMESI